LTDTPTAEEHHENTVRCDECGDEIAESDAHTEQYPGVEGAVTLYFCSEHTVRTCVGP